MIHQAVKVRIYPSPGQSVTLAQHFGCARWWWNYALNKCIETYKETGKGLTRSAMNSMLPKLKKEKDTQWLAECHSQVLQSVSLNLSRAYLNFFAGRAKYPRFKSKHKKQSIQYPQKVKQVETGLKFPGKLGIIKAKIHRPIDGEIKTVTVSKTPSGKYYASVLLEKADGTATTNCISHAHQEEGESPPSLGNLGVTKGGIAEGKTIGIDLGIKDFAITYDGEKISKYNNPKHISKHEQNLKRKQQKLARKQQGSNRRQKASKLVAKVYERLSNVRQDFLHKLSRKIVNNNQVVVVENHLALSRASCADAGSLVNVKGMIRNHSPLYLLLGGMKEGSGSSWEKFVNFLDYKLSQEGKLLVEIERFFPSSKICSNCHYQIDKLPLEIRNWTCPSCGTHHDRDGNGAKNIRAEGIRMLKTDGTAVSANGGSVSLKLGRVSRLGNSL